MVLPALTWQGQNPVDQDGDGIPNTLDVGEPVSLTRPFANGLPDGFSDEAALLAYLDSSHLPYQLTSDVALIDGTGPALPSSPGVAFVGTARWLPASLGATLRSYVQGGGRVLSIGVDSMRSGVTVQGQTVSAPTAPATTDALGAHPGALVNHNTQLLLVIRDGLGIFSATSGALGEYATFQPFQGVSPPGRIVSEAGTSASATSIIGYQLGRGTVVAIGLPQFGSSLASDTDAQELIRRVWALLSR